MTKGKIVDNIQTYIHENSDLLNREVTKWNNWIPECDPLMRVGRAAASVTEPEDLPSFICLPTIIPEI